MHTHTPNIILTGFRLELSTIPQSYPHPKLGISPVMRIVPKFGTGVPLVLACEVAGLRYKRVVTHIAGS
jgi:hypothetical protein